MADVYNLNKKRKFEDLVNNSVVTDSDSHRICSSQPDGFACIRIQAKQFKGCKDPVPLGWVDIVEIILGFFGEVQGVGFCQPSSFLTSSQLFQSGFGSILDSKIAKRSSRSSM